MSLASATRPSRERIGRFHVVRQLGEGGFGAVYEVHEEGRREHARALKLLIRSDARSLHRFKPENANRFETARARIL